MADWFKFYENGMDEPRFRYALRTLSEVCPVWLLTLSECCRHRSDSFRWTGDEVDLIGWSEKACTSPPKVNEAMKLLEKIKYIEIGEGYIKVLNWNKLQSEYCRKASVKTPDSVRSVSGQSPEFVRREERRGEENNSIRGSALNGKVTDKGKRTLELLDLCKEVLGETEMKKCHKRWYDRATKEPDKLERVLNDMVEHAKNGGIYSKSAGARAEQLWGQFK